MMGAAHDMPEIARLAAARVAVRDRLRWLSPNAKRARELLAEQRRMTLEELRLEVRPESQKARKPEIKNASEAEDAPDRTRWWDR